MSSEDNNNKISAAAAVTTTSTTSTSSSSSRANDAFDRLTDEIVYLVLSFVEPTFLLQDVCLACKRFAAVIQNESFWRYSIACTAKILTQEDACHNLRFSKNHLQQYALYDQAVKTNDDHIRTNILDHGSILPDREIALEAKAGGRYTCAASTTDRLTEGIENVLRLPPRVRFRSRQVWWSSRPTIEPDMRNEVLLFTTRAPLCLLTHFEVEPLLDPYMRHVVYSWKYTRIRAYLIPHETNQFAHGRPCTFAPDPAEHSRTVGGEARLPFFFTPLSRPGVDSSHSIDAVLRNQSPVYEQTWPVLNEDRPGIITGQLPASGIVANLIRVELIGKYVEQTPGSGYYACIKALDCAGIVLEDGL